MKKTEDMWVSLETIWGYAAMQNFVELSYLVLSGFWLSFAFICVVLLHQTRAGHFEVLRSQCPMHVLWGSGSRCSETDVLEIRSCILESAQICLETLDHLFVSWSDFQWKGKNRLIVLCQCRILLVLGCLLLLFVVPVISLNKIRCSLKHLELEFKTNSTQG